MEAFNTLKIDLELLSKQARPLGDYRLVRDNIANVLSFVKALENKKVEKECSKHVDTLHTALAANDMPLFTKHLNAFREWLLELACKHLIVCKKNKLSKQGQCPVAYALEAWITDFVIRVLSQAGKVRHKEGVKIIQDYLRLTEPFRLDEEQGDFLLPFIWVCLQQVLENNLSYKEHRALFVRLEYFCNGYHGIGLLLANIQ